MSTAERFYRMDAQELREELFVSLNVCAARDIEIAELRARLAEVERERDEALQAAEIRELVIARKDEQIKQAQLPTYAHMAWESLIRGTPRGYRPMPVYMTEDGHVVVCGPPDQREDQHNCDSLGCSSVSHVAWRGHVDDFWPLLWGHATDAAIARAEAAEKRAEEAERERKCIEAEWEVLATKSLDCAFDRMKRRDAESDATALREVLNEVLTATVHITGDGTYCKYCSLAAKVCEAINPVLASTATALAAGQKEGQ